MRRSNRTEWARWELCHASPAARHGSRLASDLAWLARDKRPKDSVRAGIGYDRHYPHLNGHKPQRRRRFLDVCVQSRSGLSAIDPIIGEQFCGPWYS